MLVAVHAGDGAQRLEVVRQRLGVFRLGNRLGQGLSDLGIAGAALQQAIPPVAQFPPRLPREGARVFEQGLEMRIPGRQLCVQTLGETRHDHIARRATGLEQVDALVVPAQQHLLGRALQIRRVDVNLAALADAVEAADTLFELIRVRGQIEQHQMPGKLKVAPLAADLRADQRLGALFGLGKVGRRPVALDQAQALVKGRGANPRAPLQVGLQGQRGSRADADHQHLLRAQRAQLRDQPRDPRVLAQPAFPFEDPVRVRPGPDCALGVGLGQGIGVQPAPGKAADRGAAVAKQHAAGAVAIDQGGGDLRCRKAARNIRGQALGPFTAIERVEQIAPAFVFPLLGRKRLEIVKARGIEQGQALKMRLLTHLLRGGGEQQQAGAVRGQSFHKGVQAGVYRGRKPVCFVHDDQIPTRGQGQQLQGLVREQIDRAQRQLFAGEGVDAARLRVQAFAIEQRKSQVEAPAHFHQPLKLQRRRHQHQRPAAVAGQQLAVQDHARFDGFAQAHFIGEQHARRVALTDLPGHVQLMGQQRGAHPQQAAQAAALQAIDLSTGGQAHRESRLSIHLTGEQALARGAEIDAVVQVEFGDPLALFGYGVEQQGLFLMHRHNGAFAAVASAQGIADAQLEPGQRRAVDGVGALFLHRGKMQRYAARVFFDNDSEPQRGVRVADPALSDRIGHQAASRSGRAKNRRSLLARHPASSVSTGSCLISATRSAMKGRKRGALRWPRYGAGVR